MNVEGNSITIGSFHAGGIVFYLDEKNQYGLVCAPSDQGSFHWGCASMDIQTEGTVGWGRANTNRIIDACNERPIAASVCADLVLNGYDDWFLPSHDELTLMLDNLKSERIGDFIDDCYWSSTQGGDWDIAYPVNFAVRPESTKIKDYHKLSHHQVRAVRSFNFSTI